MYKCEECNEEFKTFQAKANHVRWKHEKYDKEKFHKKSSASAKIANDKRFGKWIEEDIICSKEKCDCNNIVHVKYREGKKKDKYFCSQRCANIRKHTKESKLKISKAVKKSWDNGVYDTEEYRNKQLKNKIFSSEIEREIVSYFKEKYPDQNWKSGGNIRIKNNRIVRDLWNDELKICFEYDGVWHFEDINNQLKNKQKKDKLLENWCLENNYRLIRIDELEYESLEQIEKLIFERNEPIIKIGKRY